MQQLVNWYNNNNNWASTALYAAPVAVAAVVAARWCYNNRGLPPGPYGLPIIGCLETLDHGTMHMAVHEMSKRYGGIFSFRLGSQLIIAITEYHLMKECLDNPVFAGRPRIPIFQRFTKNRGIIFSEGENWQVQRRTSLKILRDFGFAREKSAEIIDNAIDVVLDELNALAKSHQPCQVAEIMIDAANSVVAQMTFGRQYKGDEDFLRFTTASKPLFVGDFFSLAVKYPSIDYLIRWLPVPNVIQKNLQVLHDFVNKEISQRELVMKNESCEPECLCDAYILEKRKAESRGDYESFKDPQMLRVCLELFSAGTDTTARSIEWLLLYMACYPEVQTKVHQEIDSVLGQSRRPRMADKSNLNYTSAVIDEVYRMASISGFGLFHRAVHETQFHGYRIPDDAIVQPIVYSVHRDPQLWERPFEFYPEHFLDSNGEYRPSQHCIPFLIGKRFCLGESLAKMEVVTIFVAVMQHFRVTATEDTMRNRDKVLTGKLGLVVAPQEYQIVFSKR